MRPSDKIYGVKEEPTAMYVPPGSIDFGSFEDAGNKPKDVLTFALGGDTGACTPKKEALVKRPTRNKYCLTECAQDLMVRPESTEQGRTKKSSRDFAAVPAILHSQTENKEDLQ